MFLVGEYKYFSLSSYWEQIQDSFFQIIMNLFIAKIFPQVLINSVEIYWAQLRKQFFIGYWQLKSN
jgi:hypothetical protein